MRMGLNQEFLYIYNIFWLISSFLYSPSVTPPILHFWLLLYIMFYIPLCFRKQMTRATRIRYKTDFVSKPGFGSINETEIHFKVTF